MICDIGGKIGGFAISPYNDPVFFVAAILCLEPQCAIFFVYEALSSEFLEDLCNAVIDVKFLFTEIAVEGYTKDFKIIFLSPSRMESAAYFVIKGTASTLAERNLSPNLT